MNRGRVCDGTCQKLPRVSYWRAFVAGLLDAGVLAIRIPVVGLESIGKLLVGAAVALLVVGGLFLLLSRIGLDRLPGDLVFRHGNLTVYFPIGVMILLSIVGTILLNLFLRR